MTIVVLRVQRRLNWFYRNLMLEEFEFMKYFIGSSCRIARDVENIVKNNKQHQKSLLIFATFKQVQRLCEACMRWLVVGTQIKLS